MPRQTNKSESNLHFSIRPKELEQHHPDHQEHIIQGELLSKLDDSKKKQSDDGDFMREKYPSALLHCPLVPEYYKQNDLAAEDSIRLPPSLPTNQRGEVSEDPRFTSSFTNLMYDEKVKKMECYADEVRWFIGRVAKDVVFQSEVYPLHTAMYRIYMVLREYPEYHFEKLSTRDRKLLFDCCVESFMHQQQQHTTRLLTS